MVVVAAILLLGLAPAPICLPDVFTSDVPDFILTTSLLGNSVVEKLDFRFKGVAWNADLKDQDTGVRIQYRVDKASPTSLSIPGGKEFVMRLGPFLPGDHQIEFELYQNGRLMQRRGSCFTIAAHH